MPRRFPLSQFSILFSLQGQFKVSFMHFLAIFPKFSGLMWLPLCNYPLIHSSIHCPSSHPFTFIKYCCVKGVGFSADPAFIYILTCASHNRLVSLMRSETAWGQAYLKLLLNELRTCILCVRKFKRNWSRRKKWSENVENQENCQYYLDLQNGL